MKWQTVCALEVVDGQVTAMLGERQRDGSICITAVGEHPQVESAPLMAHMRTAITAVEAQTDMSVGAVHLAMSYDRIAGLVATGSPPVLTTLDDSQIRSCVAMLEGDSCDVFEVVFNGYCAALAVTTPEQRNGGVIVLDVGKETVSLAAFVGGKLVAANACKMNGKVDAAIAEIRRAMGGDGILDKAAASMLITGRGATREILPQCEGVFGKKCSIGVPLGFKGSSSVLDNPGYAACCGLIRYAYTDGADKIRPVSPVICLMRWIFRGGK